MSGIFDFNISAYRTKMKKKRPWLFVVISVFIIAWCASGWANTGIIDGVVKIATENSEIVFGNWIRVLLLKEKAEVPEIEKRSASKPYDQFDAMVINAHMAFYKNVMEKLGDPACLAASTLTRPDGSFKFSGIAPGPYYVVVTFPSMIQGYKVAWQIPVTVDAEKPAQVILDNRNFALPTYCRK